MFGIRMTASILALAVAVPVPFAAATAQVRPAPANDAALRALADSVYQHSLETDFGSRIRARLPVDRFADFSIRPVRDAQAKRKGWATTLATIDADTLSPVDRTTWRILQFDLADDGLAETKYWLTFDLTSYLAPAAFNAAQQVLAAHPLATADDARHYRMLVDAYATMLDSLVAKVAEQTARGIYLPRPALPVVRTTWQGIAGGTGALKPADDRLAPLPAQARATLARDIDAIAAKRLNPGFAKLAATIGDDYASKAPETVGIGQYPGGKDVYRALVRESTTLPLTPEELQQRGLAAVADVEARMKAIREKLGFTGTSREFYDRISKDPRFLAKTPADIEATYSRYIRAIEPKVSRYFRTLPKAPYGVERLPLAIEAGQTFGYYGPPTAAEPRGLYHYNASNLEKRSLINAGTLIYHELIPGHHFHIATQDENPALSPFRRQYLSGAFTEGWGEYAASLPIEMGLYDTPEALYGRYVNESFLAARLVVDSGMNYFGWSLEKARAYMHDATSLSDLEIASETLRYSTSLPAQALAYRIGYEKFWELRHRAEAALGAKFDIRDFHDVVLGNGARPMAVVETDVDAYIAARRGS